MGEINEYKTADNVIVSLFSAGKIFSHQKKEKNDENFQPTTLSTLSPYLKYQV